ncbi:MAG: toxin-antitoxin system HicB family antitoxin [Oscillospiraceae bacterium]|nr:toxin-antitoxin system HicB family antitoxin [Oscillospiraceae bacterium]
MTFNLRLSDELDHKIKVIAKNERRSKNKQIEYILQEYVKEYEDKNGKIEPEEE